MPNRFWLPAYAALGLIALTLLAVILLRERGEAGVERAGAGHAAQVAELERRVAGLRQDLATGVCPPGSVPAPLRAQPEILPNNRLREPEAAPAAGAATEPSSPASPAGPLAVGAEQTTTPLPTRDLVALLNGATALVLTQDGSASGFFIGPDLLVTNRHAVEDAAGVIFVTSKQLGRVHRGTLLAMSEPGSHGGADFALVRIDEGRAQITLGFATHYESLMPVVAAGYPGLTIVHDIGFRALLEGDVTAAPELVLNRGEVQAIQRSPHGLEVLAHSGRILQGNSGGPLVDGCGRVVGINTYIAVDARQAGQVSYAIASSELAGFVAENGAAVRIEDSACSS